MQRQKLLFTKTYWEDPVKKIAQLFLPNSRVHGHTECDFVVFTNVDLHIERMYFDIDFWHKIVPELSSFYTEYITRIVINIMI
jgi:hypothetical protein